MCMWHISPYCTRPVALVYHTLNNPLFRLLCNVHVVFWGPCNNWKIINFINKNISVEDFDDVNKFVLYGNSDNMEFIARTDKYYYASTTDPTTMGYYVVKFLSIAMTLQEEKTKYGKTFKSGELTFTAEYLSIIKSMTNYYW